MHRIKEATVPVFLLAFIVRLLFLIFFRDSFIDSGRMIPLATMASTFADSGRFCNDPEFIDLFGKTIDADPPVRRNLEFYRVEKSIGRTARCVQKAEITDAPGYAVLLGLFWKVFPVKSYIYLQLLQLLLDCGATICIMSIVRRLSGNGTIAWWAGVAYACFPTFALLTVVASRDYYASWGAVFSLDLFLRNVYAKRSPAGYVLSGTVLALFSWFRPTVFLLPGVFTVATMLLVKRHRISDAVGAAIGTAVPVVLLFILPFGLQYHRAYGTGNFTKGMTGGMLWEGLGRFSDKYHFVCNDKIAYKRAVELGYPDGAPAWVPAYSELLMRDALRVMKKDPLWYAGTVIRRYVRFFFARPLFPLSEHGQVSFRNNRKPLTVFIRRYPVIAFEKAVKTVAALLMPLLAVAALFLCRRAWRPVAVLIMVWQYRILVGVGTHLEDRYVMECYFPVVILTVWSLHTLVHTIGTRKAVPHFSADEESPVTVVPFESASTSDHSER